MMRYLLCFILLLPAVSLAAEQAKPFTLSLVSYATVVTNNIPFSADDELSGLGFTATGVFHDSGAAQAAVRGTLAFLTHDDFSLIDATTIEISLLGGQRLNTTGFKWYLGGGIFSEKWEGGGASETFSGLQLTAGLGYNWAPVALDFWISVRDASDYEELLKLVGGPGTSASAAAGGLALGVRF